MPKMFIHAPHGTFTPESRKKIAYSLTDLGMACEHLLDTPQVRAGVWVYFSEHPTDSVFRSGHVAEQRIMSLLIYALKGGLDTRRAVDGIAPNFVHSLDAAHLMTTVTAAKHAGITDVAVIHDSFATHASNMDALSSLLRRTFVDLYEGNPLLAFRDEVLDQIQSLGGSSDLVPPLPPTGSLDLRSIEDATYMFA